MATQSQLQTKMTEVALANRPSPPWTTTEAAMELLLAGIQDIVSASGRSSSVVTSSVLLGASDSQTVPAGSKGYLVSFLSGTGTFAGVAVPAGFSVSSANTQTNAITVTTDATSSAVIVYET